MLQSIWNKAKNLISWDEAKDVARNFMIVLVGFFAANYVIAHPAFVKSFAILAPLIPSYGSAANAYVLASAGWTALKNLFPVIRMGLEMNMAPHTTITETTQTSSGISVKDACVAAVDAMGLQLRRDKNDKEILPDWLLQDKGSFDTEGRGLSDALFTVNQKVIRKITGLDNTDQNSDKKKESELRLQAYFSILFANIHKNRGLFGMFVRLVCAVSMQILYSRGFVLSVFGNSAAKMIAGMLSLLILRQNSKDIYRFIVQQYAATLKEKIGKDGFTQQNAKTELENRVAALMQVFYTIQRPAEFEATYFDALTIEATDRYFANNKLPEDTSWLGKMEAWISPILMSFNSTDKPRPGSGKAVKEIKTEYNRLLLTLI